MKDTEFVPQLKASTEDSARHHFLIEAKNELA